MNLSGYSRICLEAAGWSVPLMAGACAVVGLSLLFEDQLERAQVRGQKAIVRVRIARRRAWRMAGTAALRGRASRR